MEMLIHGKLRRPDGMPKQEFFGIWKQEATAALEAVKAGIIKNIWKVLGKYEVFLVMEVDSVDQMDEMMQSLPIWKLGYDYIVSSMEWVPLRSYEHWAKQLEELSAK